LLSRAARAAPAASAVDGDRRDPGRAGARDWRALSRPIHRRHRGEELEAPSRRRARRPGDRPHRDDAGRARRRRAVVTADGGVDRRRHPGPLRQGPHAARAAGRTRVAEQAVPHLPQPGRRGRPPRSGAGRHRDAPDPRSAHSSGAAGRRQHAGLRQESQPRGSQRARRVHGNAAPMSAWPVEPSVSVPVVVTAAVYLRGWSLLRRRLAQRFDARHAGLFMARLASMLFALASSLSALSLESDLWHHVEHACFLVSALLFWRPVILAWPARMTWARWTMIPYLGLAMFQSLPLAAILTFSDRVIYAGYSSLDDQALAGVIMWVPGSLPLLLWILRLIVELSSNPVAMARSHV